jgi:hypothetical protein
MSSKIPQRNVNLAARYNRLARRLLELSEAVLSPGAELGKLELEMIQNELFDTISLTREYVRRISPIEKVGNRG